MNIKSCQPDWIPPVRFCPLEKHANSIIRSGRQIVYTMHRLRRSMRRCASCPANPSCDFREQFNQQVDAVIAEINEEWGLV
jgi:hypothetical protein